MRFCRSSAFTLIELMVACSITAILAVVMLTALSGILGQWKTTETRIDAYSEARSALKLLAGELQVAYPTIGEKPAIYSDGASNARTLRFLTDVSMFAQPEAENQSEVCGVEYFLAPPQTGNGQALYRTLISSKTTFERLESQGTPFTEIPSVSHPNTELVAQNVVRFAVVLRDKNYQEITDPTKPPKFAEVELQTIGGRNAEDYFGADAPGGLKEKILREQGRTFVQRTTL